jgi:Tfp pilus assembly protein PilO
MSQRDRSGFAIEETALPKAPNLLRVHALWCGVLLASTALVYFAGIAPLIKERSHLREEKQRLAAKREERKLIEQRGKATYAELHEVERKLESAVKLKPPQQINRRLESIIALVENSGLALTEHTPGQAVSGKQYGYVPIRMTGEGTYPAVLAFVRSLHENFKDVEVRQLDIKSAVLARDSLPTFSVDMVWYTLPENAGSEAMDRADRAEKSGREAAAKETLDQDP